MIEGFINRIDKPKPLLTLIGKYIQAETAKMFTSRPDLRPVRGQKWDKLAESTILRKWDQGKKLAKFRRADRPLVDTGLMRDDLLAPRSIKIKDKGLEYGTERRNKKGVLYPALHQTGTANMPKRRFLFLNENDLFQIGRTTIEYIEGRKDTLKGMQRHDYFRYGGD